MVGPPGSAAFDVEAPNPARLRWLVGAGGQPGSIVFGTWSYARRLVIGGAPQLLDTGAPIWISQILSDGSVLGSERIEPRTFLRMKLNEPVEREEQIREVRWTDNELAVSPDAERVAFVSTRNGVDQIWVSKIDGSEARVLVAAIPPYGDYGDNTMAGDLSWSPDGQWIAFLTSPGVGHGDPEARMFIVPSAGGALRVLAELCSLDGRGVPWTADSRSVFIAKEKIVPGEEVSSESDYFQLDILTGKLTPVSEASLPPRPMTLAPSPVENARLALGGQYLYFERRGESKERIVMVHGLLPKVP